MKTFKFISAILACLAITACQTTGTTAPAVAQQAANLQQLAATQCPIINGFLTTLSGLQLPPDKATALAAATAANESVCKDVSTVDVMSIQTLITSVTPVIIDAAKSAGMAAAQQDNLVLAVGVVQASLQLAITEQHQLDTTPLK
jgi:hypothetical protein